MSLEITERLMTTGDVAKAHKVSAEVVRVWANQGKLCPVTTTVSGMRLFASDDVDRFIADRLKAE